MIEFFSINIDTNSLQKSQRHVDGIIWMNVRHQVHISCIYLIHMNTWIIYILSKSQQKMDWIQSLDLTLNGSIRF